MRSFLNLGLTAGRRLLGAAALVAAVLVLNFVLLRLAPGDAALAIAGGTGGATEEILSQIRRAHGLDEPLHRQLLVYLGRTLSGDLGHSLYLDAPVAELVLARLWPTVLLVATAMAAALALGTVMGVLAARRPGGAVDRLVAALALAGWSAPAFWTGILMLLAFAAAVPLFPLGGMQDLRFQGTGLARALDAAHHLVLPALTLAIASLAPYSRVARASMLDALGADYIRTARAKGLGERAVLWRHALRNALVPVVTLAGYQAGTMLSGAVLVETVFDWPGLGRLAFESILRRDHPTLLGILVFAAAMAVAANLLTDLACRIVDPRIEAGTAGGRRP